MTHPPLHSDCYHSSTPHQRERREERCAHNARMHKTGDYSLLVFCFFVFFACFSFLCTYIFRLLFCLLFLLLLFLGRVGVFTFSLFFVAGHIYLYGRYIYYITIRVCLWHIFFLLVFLNIYIYYINSGRIFATNASWTFCVVVSKVLICIIMVGVVDCMLDPLARGFRAQRKKDKEKRKRKITT